MQQLTKHAVIPDCQVKPDCDISYLTHVGEYLAEKQPDVIVQIGDFAHMPSLSSYEVGKKAFAGKRYKDDVAYTKKAMAALLKPIQKLQKYHASLHKKQYNPRMILTLGNHEHRIHRAINNDAAKLDGVISVDDLGYRPAGWEVHEFLDTVVVDSIVYSHYFVTGVMGRPVTSPAALISKKHMSCVMGHVQQRGVAYGTRADGKEIKGIFAGTCYTHNEDYLGPQGNKHWRGIWMFHEVNDGQFDELQISLPYLQKRYG